MKTDNIAIFNDTLDIAKRGNYLCEGKKILLQISMEQMKEVQSFSPERIQQLMDEEECTQTASDDRGEIRTYVSGSDSYEAAISMKKRDPDRAADAPGVLVLNFANPVNPGGGVTRGANAQEEDLCRRSTLYLSLTSEAAREMYEYNAALRSYCSSDFMLLSPKVEIFKDSAGNPLPETFLVSVLTAAAPMVSYGGIEQKALHDLLVHRIRAIFQVAASSGYRDLVLGAWGCGAFGKNPENMDALFAQEVERWNAAKHCPFRKIEFAVLRKKNRDSHNYNCFARYFPEK
ncbi:MAG: TIGR02452 family protein [Lachnospiraceae bacterium]|nr:TIGR02452 family protein [Lachnospiraceae bacterium]